MFHPFDECFSKKIKNRCHPLAVYLLCYNFDRIHKSLKTAPAIAAGMTDGLCEIEDLVALLDGREACRAASREARKQT